MKNKPIGRLAVATLALLFISSAWNMVATPLYSVQAAPTAPIHIYFPIIANHTGVNQGPLYDWLQFNLDVRHTGNNTLETRITTGNVNTLHLLFQATLPDVADGAPAYLNTVLTNSGTRDLVFLTTRDGHITARDAHSGAEVWSKQYGPGGCLVNKSSSRNQACYTTSSPAIDPNRQFVYSYGLDGKAHKYAVGTGSEVIDSHWPELTSLKVYDEKGSSDLSIATAKNGVSYLYVAHAGYPGDAGDYQGHITAINLSDGTQKVFNAVCSNNTAHFIDSRITSGPDCSAVQTAIWARPGVVYSPDTDRIYMSTGNGDFKPGSFDWGDTIFALNPNGTGAGNGNPLDSYTPTNFQALQDGDIDIGSTAPAILPPSSGKFKHLAVQSGKDGKLRLLNLDNLSNQGGTGHTGGEISIINLATGGEVLTQPAVWVNPADSSTWVFVADGNGIAAYQLSIDGSGNPSLTFKWQKGEGGFSPILANGVLYYAQSGKIFALNPLNGSVLWSSTQISGIHWESPIVANGVVYITDEGKHLTAFTLP